jgi:predicted dehydrogenase
MIRVGVVGLRFGARVHVPAFRGDSRCVVTALAGRTLEGTAAMAAELGIPGSYAGWRALLAQGAIDAISIAVPPAEQPAIIVEAARHGKHVFCEKPLASTVSAAEEAVDAVRASGVVHAMDLIFPEIPAWRRMHDMLCSGAIGAVRHFSYVWHIETSASRTKADSWKNRSDEGGGVVANFLSHVIFNLEWLLGRVIEIETVQPRDGRSTVSFFDCVVYLENGVHGMVSVSTDAYLGGGHRLVVFGESGTAVLCNATADYAGSFELRLGTRESGRLDVVTRDQASPEVDGRIEPVGRIAARFLDGILGGRIPTPNLEDGLRVQRWIQRLN